MTGVLFKQLSHIATSNPLPSKGIFDNVDSIETTKPEIGVSGFVQERDSAHENSHSGNLDTPIIASVPNFHKERGTFVSDEGFIKLPRSLLVSDDWRGLTSKHQRLFLYILERVQYSPKIYKHNGIDIPVAAGQFCTTFRRFVVEFNQTVKFKDEKIDLPFLQRAVSKFARISGAIHESIHGISRITIVYPELYEHFKLINDTASDTESIQDRYTNEERKKERCLKETIDGAKALDSSPLNLEIEEEKKKAPSAHKPTNQPKFTEEKQKHFEILWKFISEHGMAEGQTPNRKPGIKEKDLITWVSKFDASEIIECLKMTLKAVPSKTWPGYVSMLLKNRIPKKEADSAKGRKLVEGVIKKNNMKHIDLKKDYFKDLISDEQTYYHLPEDTLNAILKRSYERARDKEAEDKRQQEEEDKYY